METSRIGITNVRITITTPNVPRGFLLIPDPEIARRARVREEAEMANANSSHSTQASSMMLINKFSEIKAWVQPGLEMTVWTVGFTRNTARIMAVAEMAQLSPGEEILVWKVWKRRRLPIQK
jgi:hypothetical protein